MSDSFHLSFGAANRRKVEESHKCSSLGIPNLMVGGWYPYVSEAFRHIQTNNLNSGDLWVRRWGSNFLFWQCLKPCTCCYNWSKFKTWATLETKVLFGSWTFSSHLWHEQMNCSAMRTMQGWLVWWSCTQHNIKRIAEGQVRAELVCWPYTELNTPKNKRKPLFRANRQSHRLPSLFFLGKRLSAAGCFVDCVLKATLKDAQKYEISDGVLTSAPSIGNLFQISCGWTAIELVTSILNPLPST
jgi:hypothetical protein